MLRDCIEKCPDNTWIAGGWPRSFWRITYHALFYTEFYLKPTHEDMPTWEHHDPEAPVLWSNDDRDIPRKLDPYTKGQLLQLLDSLDAQVESLLEGLDLSADHSGFPWYPIPKLDFVLVNLRHLQGHVGQLSERLMSEGIETMWCGTHPSRRNDQ